MEKYPKLTYSISGYSGFSSFDFEHILNGVVDQHGEALLNHWLDEYKLDELLSEQSEQEKQNIKEVVREYRHRCMEQQFR